MQDKVVLITGGNAGIGRQTAIALAKQGAQVVIACRNMEKGRAALVDIKEKANSEKVDVLECDLSKFEDVRNLAKTFKSTYNRLDVLLNNAGLIVSEHALTKDKYEMQIGVNHLAHFLLTLSLLDLIRQSAPSRIVSVASKAHYDGSINFDRFQGRPKKYSGLKSYAQSKLANVLFTRALAKRLEGTDVTVNCLHPGVVRTQIGNKSGWLTSMVWSLIKPFMITAEKGARTSVYLASSPEAAQFTAKYFDEKQQVQEPSPHALDDDLAEQLWAYSEQATGVQF